jgi:3-phenylpropionate/cinnamic acid dioxygenase small subunit
VSAPDDISTIVAVQRLLGRWAQLCDDRNVTGWATLFAPDAILEVNGKRYTRDAIAGWLITQSANPAGCHVTINITVTPNGPEQAISRADFVFVRRDGDTGRWQIVNVGRYTDSLVCTDGTWLFAQRQITLR